MGNIKSQMDERILVLAYYGPNGERLIRRGYELSKFSNSPFYVLTVDQLARDEFDAEKLSYIDHWQELAKELGAEKFIVRDNEERPVIQAIKEVAYNYNITQVVVGQKPQNRWEEITKGSFINVLLRELLFIDVHIVSPERALKIDDKRLYEKGIRGYLNKEADGFVLSFTKSNKNVFEGVFYKEIGTDFNNGIFRYICEGKSEQVRISDGQSSEPIKDISTNIVRK